jgi:FeS assembly SUF system protein
MMEPSADRGKQQDESPASGQPPAAEKASEPTDSPVEAGAAGAGQDDLEEQVIDVLRTVYDPEIPVNIHELGLIYDVSIDASSFVTIQMTLTAPGCPVAVSLPIEVESKVQSVPGVSGARVDVVWDPPWDMSRMSEAARLQLGFM